MMMDAEKIAANVDPTCINNESNDDDDDDGEINPIVRPHQDVVPGGADYVQGYSGDSYNTCGSTRYDCTSGPTKKQPQGCILSGTATTLWRGI
jgi:hypothetical protein